MGSSERGFTIERKCQFSGKKLKSLQHLQTHPNMTNISNKQLIMSYVQFYHHKVWQIYFWNHKRDRFWHSKIPFCKTSNLEMKERFNQKLQENKPPLTLQNTYLKVCLKMRRAFLVFFGFRHGTLLYAWYFVNMVKNRKLAHSQTYNGVATCNTLILLQTKVEIKQEWILQVFETGSR